MITVTAVQKVKPGKEAELDVLMHDLQERIRAHEPGCLRFEYLRASDQEGTRLVYEQYQDLAAFEYHKTTAHLRAFLPGLLECLEQPPEVTTYTGIDTVAAPASFFHVGMVVPDLEKAVAQYSDVLGIRFTEPAVFDIPRLEDPYPHPFQLTAVFSRTQPPYYELIQAQGDGIVSAAHAGKILYYGCWEADMAGRLEQLRAQAVGVDAVFRSEAGGTPFAIITGPDLLGARIEYVGVESMGAIEQWVATGIYPGGIGG